MRVRCIKDSTRSLVSFCRQDKCGDFPGEPHQIHARVKISHIVMTECTLFSLRLQSFYCRPVHAEPRSAAHGQTGDATFTEGHDQILECNSFQTRSALHAHAFGCGSWWATLVVYRFSLHVHSTSHVFAISRARLFHALSA